MGSSASKVISDRNKALEALEQARPPKVFDVLQTFSADLLGDKELMLKALEQAQCDDVEYVFDTASADLQGDKEVTLKTLELLPGDLVTKMLRDSFADHRGDKEVVLKAVARFGPALQNASVELQGDKDVVLKALEQCEIPESESTLAKTLNVMAVASVDLRDDKEVMLKAVRAEVSALSFASDRLRGDKDLVMEALEHAHWVRVHGVFGDISADLRGDKEVVLKVLNLVPPWETSRVLKTAFADLLGDKEVMLKALEVVGCHHEDCVGDVLALASADMRDDKEVMLKAVLGSGRAFEYATPRLKGDKISVLEAVRCGYRTRDLPLELRRDPDVRRASQACYYGLTNGSEKVTFIGAVAKRRRGRCYSSFPGKHAKAWNGLTRMADAGKLSTACVFLTTKKDGLGCHSKPCMCGAVYGQVPAERYICVVEKGPKDTDKEYEIKVADAKKDAQAMQQILLEKAAFGTEEAWKKAYGEALALAEKQAKDCNYVAPWGCMWFALWRAKVEEARKLDQELVVVYFKGKTGKGKLPWCDLANPEKLKRALEDNGLGFSQRAEIAWLEKCGYPITEIDITAFCAECRLPAPTE